MQISFLPPRLPFTLFLLLLSCVTPLKRKAGQGQKYLSLGAETLTKSGSRDTKRSALSFEVWGCTLFFSVENSTVQMLDQGGGV